MLSEGPAGQLADFLLGKYRVLGWGRGVSGGEGIVNQLSAAQEDRGGWACSEQQVKATAGTCLRKAQVLPHKKLTWLLTD